MTDQQLSFDYDMATMALKAKRFKEAEERFMNIGSKTNSWEAWCGLGIAKYGLIMENISVEEVFYCFQKAKSIDDNKVSEIETAVIETSIDVIKNLYELVSICQQSIEQANRQMVRSAITGIIGAAMTMRYNSQGKVMGSIISAGVTAISFENYVNSKTTVAELKMLYQKSFKLIDDIKRNTLEFAIIETELAAKFNRILSDTHNEITVIAPQKKEANKRQKEKKDYKHYGYAFYLSAAMCLIFFISPEIMTSIDPEMKMPRPLLLLFALISAGIGNDLLKKSKELRNTNTDTNRKPSHLEQTMQYFNRRSNERRNTNTDTNRKPTEKNIKKRSNTFYGE